MSQDRDEQANRNEELISKVKSGSDSVYSYIQDICEPFQKTIEDDNTSDESLCGHLLQKLSSEGQTLPQVLEEMEKVNWELESKGTMTKEELAEMLKLELAPSALVPPDRPAKYEEVKKVMQLLDDIAQEHGFVYMGYVPVIEECKKELVAFEEKIRNSHVEMDGNFNHEPFFSAVDALREKVLSSVEHVVASLDDDAKKEVQKYVDLLKEQKVNYEEDARVVETASKAKLRPSNPHDAEEFWERPIQEQQPHCASSELQALLEEEENNKVYQDYESEWYMEHRRDVDRLLPRAHIVIEEQDEDKYYASLDILRKLVDICERKGKAIDGVAKDSGKSADELIETLQKHQVDLQKSSDDYQLSMRSQREYSERDMRKLENFMQQEENKNEQAAKTYSNMREELENSLKQQDEAVLESWKRIQAEQQNLKELIERRNQILTRFFEEDETEKKRTSKFNETIRICETYRELLFESMQSFLLPQGYGEKLCDFVSGCEQIAENIRDKQQEILALLLVKSVREYYCFSLSDFVALQVGLHRKHAKLADLEVKAEQARKQRQFCLQTKDPLANKHEDTEKLILDLTADLREAIEKLNAASNTSMDNYLSSYEASQKLGVFSPQRSRAYDGERDAFEDGSKSNNNVNESTDDTNHSDEDLVLEINAESALLNRDIQDLSTELLSTHHFLITRAPRIPLVNLAHGKEQRLFVPPKYFVDGSPQRIRRLNK